MPMVARICACHTPGSSWKKEVPVMMPPSHPYSHWRKTLSLSGCFSTFPGSTELFHVFTHTLCCNVNQNHLE